jgi:hypothetical protein
LNPQIKAAFPPILITFEITDTVIGPLVFPWDRNMDAPAS